MPFNIGESYAEPVGRPEESLSDVAAAAWNNMDLTGTFVGSTIDGWKREGLSKIGKKLPPAEANKIFPELNADRDITISEAEFIMEKRNKVKANQQIIDSASDSFLKGTVVPFVAGAASAMTDPIDMGINFITGGIGSGLKVGASGARAMAIDAVEAAAGAAIAEIPVALEMKDTFEDYTAKNFLTNVIGASVLQVGLMHGLPSAWKGTAKSLDFMGAKTSDNLIKLAEVLEKKGINSTPTINKAVNKIKEMTGKADEVHMSIKETLNGKVELGDDMIDSLKNVMSAHQVGKITDEELIAFRDHAIELGVDEKVLNQAVDNNNPLQFDDQIADDIKKMNSDPSSKQTHNPEAKKVNEGLDDFDPEKFTNDHLSQKQEKLDAESKADPDKVDADVKEVSSAREKAVQEREFLRELAACRRGA